MPPIAPVPVSASGQSSARGLVISGVGREKYAVDIALVQRLRGYGTPPRSKAAPALSHANANADDLTAVAGHGKRMPNVPDMQGLLRCLGCRALAITA